MDLTAPVWLYCERGMTTDHFNEPVNLVSSLAFLIAVIAASWIYRKLPEGRKSADHLLLIGLLVLTGLGSAAFHLFANQWSELSHILPLILFMLVSLAFTLNRFLDVPPGSTVVIVGFVAVASFGGLTMTCGFVDLSLQPPWSRSYGGGTSCLNGSAGFLPIILVLAVLSVVLYRRGHRAARSHTLVTLIFIVSLAAQSIDHVACEKMVFDGHAIGTHFVWHLLNALALFLLLRSTMVDQCRPLVQEIIPPKPKEPKNS